MKKVICKVEYDTENAKLIAKYTNGNFGDTFGMRKAFMRQMTESSFYM